MHKNGALIVSAALIAVNLFIGTAYAYPVTSSGQPVAESSSFDFGTSISTLFSPFQNFVKSIEESNKTTIDIHQGEVAPLPNYRLDVGSYLKGFDDWAYVHIGARPSGIFVAGMQVLSWVLGIAKNVVDWILHVLG